MVSALSELIHELFESMTNYPKARTQRTVKRERGGGGGFQLNVNNMIQCCTGRHFGLVGDMALELEQDKLAFYNPV